MSINKKNLKKEKKVLDKWEKVWYNMEHEPVKELFF